jgi:Plasmid pRiA4b ORF-3-like protein
MSDAATCPNLAVYQLRVMVGISPLIWRRVLIPADTTIAGLHAVLQTVFGWGGEHLHRFVIRGTEYGISSVGGPGFRDDARQVRLGELGLRLGECSRSIGSGALHSLGDRAETGCYVRRVRCD